MAPTSSSSTDDDAMAQLNLRGLSTADYLKAESKLTISQKSALASGLAKALDTSSIEAGHFAEAEAILRLLIWNAEPNVVEAIGKAVASNPHAPHSLAWALANDDEPAALPVLQSSNALSDDDLVSIIEASGNFTKMGAIANRPTVSEIISKSLVQYGDESTMQTLLANAKALISDDAFGQMLDRFGALEGVQQSVADRESLPASIAQRLAESGSASVMTTLVQRHQMVQPKLVQMPGYLDEASTDEEQARQISSAIAQKLLNEAALVRQLCFGNFDYFCRALSALAGFPKSEVIKRVLESPAANLPQYWEKASLAKEWLPVASAAVSALIYIDQNYDKADRDLFTRNIHDRTLANVKAEKIALNDVQKRFFFRPIGR